MSEIGHLIADGRVQTRVIVVVNISGHAGLCVGQVSEDGPEAGLQFFGFQARLEALGLGVVVAFAPAALRPNAALPLEQGAVGPGAVLPLPDPNAPPGRERVLGRAGLDCNEHPQRTSCCYPFRLDYCRRDEGRLAWRGGTTLNRLRWLQMGESQKPTTRCRGYWSTMC